MGGNDSPKQIPVRAQAPKILDFLDFNSFLIRDKLNYANEIFL
jgi:hypothetical protein